MKKAKALILVIGILVCISGCENKNQQDNMGKNLHKNNVVRSEVKDKNEGKNLQNKDENKSNIVFSKTDNKKSLENKKVDTNQDKSYKDDNFNAKNNIKQQIKSKKLNNIIVLDPGHASRGDLKKEQVAPGSTILKYRQTAGADGVLTKTPEYKVNMNVALKLKNQLEHKGFKVIMTKTDNNKTMSNIERAKVGNNTKAALVIRLHADSADNQLANGASMLIPANIQCTRNIYSDSKRFGEKIQKSLINNVGMKDRGIIEREDLTGFNWSKVPVVLLEMGFLSNEKEDKLLSNSEYQSKISEGIANGVYELFK